MCDRISDFWVSKRMKIQLFERDLVERKVGACERLLGFLQKKLEKYKKKNDKKLVSVQEGRITTDRVFV